MSAYNVSDLHLARLVSVLATLTNYAPDSPSIITRENPGKKVGAGDAFGVPFWRLYPSDQDDAVTVFRHLARENRCSVAYRYREEEEPMPEAPATWPKIGTLRDIASIAAAIKAIDCYEYQACEHPGWAASEVAGWLAMARSQLVRRVPGFAAAYEASPWG